MEQLKNFLPLIVFVVAYVTTDIYVATAALMIAVTVQVGLTLLFKKPLSMELKVTFWVGLVMGSLTLFFQDEKFIQWKTTVVNWIMASALVVTHFVGKSYGTELVLKKMLAGDKSASNTEPAEAPRDVWRTVNLIWIASFALAGALNLVVAFNFSLDFWVTYKLVGGFLLTFTTIVITMFYLYRKGLLDHLEQETPSDTGPEQEAP